MQRILFLSATILVLNSCSLFNEGCTENSACNYDDDAVLNDGSCEYPDNGDYSLSFDGEDDYVDLGSQLDLVGDFTIEANIKISDSDDVHTIYAISDETYSSSGSVKGYMFHVYNGILKLGYRLNNGISFGAVSANTTMDYNQWYNVAVTRSNNEIQLFIDSELVGSGTFSSDLK